MKTRKKCKLKKGGNKTINERIRHHFRVMLEKIWLLYLWVCEKFTKKTGRQPNNKENTALWGMCVDEFLKNSTNNSSTDTNQTDIYSPFSNGVK